jgi:hypothetical protein
MIQYTNYLIHQVEIDVHHVEEIAVAVVGVGQVGEEG